MPDTALVTTWKVVPMHITQTIKVRKMLKLTFSEVLTFFVGAADSLIKTRS